MRLEREDAVTENDLSFSVREPQGYSRLHQGMGRCLVRMGKTGDQRPSCSQPGNKLTRCGRRLPSWNCVRPPSSA